MNSLFNVTTGTCVQISSPLKHQLQKDTRTYNYFEQEIANSGLSILILIFFLELLCRLAPQLAGRYLKKNTSNLKVKGKIGVAFVLIVLVPFLVVVLVVIFLLLLLLFFLLQILTYIPWSGVLGGLLSAITRTARAWKEPS